MTLAIKYCGGCNNHYDRAAVAALAGASLPGLEVVTAADGEYDLALVLCGCPNACVAHQGLAGRAGKWVVSHPGQIEPMLGQLAACRPGQG